MPPKSQRATNRDADDQDTSQQGEGVRGSLPGEAPAAESTATTEGDGVNIVTGPTGTIADPNDERLGTVRVKVNSNLTLGNKFYPVGPDEVEVPNTAETQAAINAGHLTLADDDDSDDEE